MRFALVLKSAVSPGIAGLQPIAFGTRAEMLALADRQYGAVHWPKRTVEGLCDERYTQDGVERAASWLSGARLCIVLADMLPRSRGVAYDAEGYI